MIEIIAVILTLASVLLTIRINSLCWPVSILAVCSYSVLFFQERLYGQMVLQGVFLIQSIYGWIYWKKTNNAGVIVIPDKKFIIDFLLVFIFGIILGSYLENNTNNPQPMLDALTTLFSLLATWYMIKKIFQGWLVWLFTNMLFILMFMDERMYPSLLLYILLLLLSIKGLFEWEKNMNMV